MGKMQGAVRKYYRFLVRFRLTRTKYVCDAGHKFSRYDESSGHKRCPRCGSRSIYKSTYYIH